jgi:hypothetical protein
MKNTLWFLINDFMDLNYLTPLIVYGKQHNIPMTIGSLTI